MTAPSRPPLSPPPPPLSPLSPPVVHPSAIVDDGAVIGNGSRIWHWVHVSGSAVIGEGCSLGQNVFVGRARLGNNVRVQNNVSIYDGVDLDDDVFCGPSMVFTNVINPRSHVPRKAEYRPTRVGRGASIGANATVVCGVTIGPYAMIGAGAVVSRDVAPHALVVGVPARRIGWVCWCGVRLDGNGADGSASVTGAAYAPPMATLADEAPSVVVACPDCARRYRIQAAACEALDPPEALPRQP